MKDLHIILNCEQETWFWMFYCLVFVTINLRLFVDPAALNYQIHLESNVLDIWRWMLHLRACVFLWSFSAFVTSEGCAQEMCSREIKNYLDHVQTPPRLMDYYNGCSSANGNTATYCAFGVIETKYISMLMNEIHWTRNSPYQRFCATQVKKTLARRQMELRRVRIHNTHNSN